MEADDDWVARSFYSRWLLAIAEKDSIAASEAADSVIQQSRRFNFDEDKWLIPLEALFNMSVLTGHSLAEAEKIADWYPHVGSLPAVKAGMFHRERGRHSEYRGLRDSVMVAQRTGGSPAWRARDQVFEWAYYGEPETEESLDYLDKVLAEDARDAEAPIRRASAVCWQTQLRLRRDSSADVSDAIRLLAEDPIYAPLAVSRMCAPFLRLLVALRTNTDVMPRVRALDEVVSVIPLDASDGVRVSLHRAAGQMELLRAANLTIARTLRDSGDTGEALAVLQRRPDVVGAGGAVAAIATAFGFTADYLREEAPLFAAHADTATAIERYEHYFRLRDQRPDYEPWAAQWDSARAELEALKAHH